MINDRGRQSPSPSPTGIQGADLISKMMGGVTVRVKKGDIGLARGIGKKDAGKGVDLGTAVTATVTATDEIEMDGGQGTGNEVLVERDIMTGEVFGLFLRCLYALSNNLYRTPAERRPIP